ncbi:MAG: hypothetical protein NBV63_00100 [Candidatus Pacebacteria bacterium]|nr:hypothetical protein [Candidatus Paceibacterota bacterium]
MSLNVANVAQTVTDTVPAVPFINWQYVYCFFVTLFGGTCAEDTLTVPSIDVPAVPSVDTVVDAAVTGGQGALDSAHAAGGGFWSWLWPFGNAGPTSGSGTGGVVDAVQPVTDVGFWASVASSIPEPIMVVLSTIGAVFSFLWNLFSILSHTLSGILFLAILVAVGGIIMIRLKEWSALGALPPRPSGKSYGWSRWQDLLDAAMTAEPKRWREAVLAADTMLGELLTRIGYHGESTVVQMRSIPEGAFVTLPQAWEAHRIRNFIAHKNSNFILTQREAFRVMKLYEQVFEEFDFI